MEQIKMGRITQLGAMKIPVNEIDTSESFLRPVDRDDPKYLIMLESIRNEGVIQSITVRIKDGIYYLIDGLHRLEMAKDCGIQEILCNVVECDDIKALSLQMQLNLPDPIRTEPAAFGRQLRRIIDLDPEMDEIALAKETNCTIGFIKQRLDLTRLPEEVQNLVDNKAIIIGNAIELTRFTRLLPEYIEAAKKLSNNEFKEYVNYKQKSSRVSKVRLNKPIFRPNPMYRSVKELLNFTNEEDTIKKITKNHESKEYSFVQGILYALNLDDETSEERIRRHVEREKQEKRDREERQKERLRKQLEELENKKEEN